MAYNLDDNVARPQGQPSQVQAPTSGFGHPVYNQIGDMFKSATGKDATMQQVSQWGTNVDPNYMNTIRTAIYNTPEAQAYQKSQQQPQFQQQTSTGQAPAPAATGSPVSADGKIPLQPAQTYSPPPAPAQRDLAPMQLPQGQLPTYGAQHFNVAVPDAYKAGELAPAYAGDKLSQFNAPNQTGNDAQQSALMQAILANPETLSPQVVAQMKEAAKGDALLMQRQTQQGFDSSNVARGTLGAGQGDAMKAQLANDTISKILDQNRALDISAAQTNRGDQLNALNASESLAQGQLGRAQGSYNTTLGGQTAQAGVNQAAAGSALSRSIAGESNQQAAAQSRLGMANFDEGQQQANAAEQYKQYQSQVAQAQDAVNRVLAQFGINQGVANNAQQNYGTDIASKLAAAQLGENQRQFNSTLGFNYNQLDQNGQLGLLNWLIQSGSV